MQDARQSRQLTAAQMASTPLRDLLADPAFPTPHTGNRYTSTVGAFSTRGTICPVEDPHLPARCQRTD